MKQILILMTLISISCSVENNVIQHEPENSQNLIIFAIDVSASFAEFPKIPPNELRKYFGGLPKNTNHDIYIQTLGNPKVHDEIISCKIKALPDVSIGRNLKEKKELVLESKRIAALNKFRIDDAIKKYISKIIEPKPSGYTDIQGFNRNLTIICNEPQYRLNTNKVLFIMSDGINSLPSKPDQYYPLSVKIENLKIYSFGLHSKAKPFNIPYTELISYHSFLNLKS